jgi:hypothetical protein
MDILFIADKVSAEMKYYQHALASINLKNIPPSLKNYCS